MRLIFPHLSLRVPRQWPGWLLASLLLFACTVAPPEQAASPTVAPAETATLVPTSTSAPTTTPLPPVGLLLAPEGADGRLVDQMQALLAEWIPAAGMRYQVRPTLSLNDLERENFRWVIALPPVANLAELAAAAPDSRFLAYGFSNLEPAANLSVLSLPEDAELQQAFMAGYIGAVITPDWRIGMIGLTTPESSAAREAFKSGALFYCSSPSAPDQELFCRPKYAPIYQYPFYVAGDAGASSGEWEATARTLLNYVVETVYVYPGAGDAAMLRYLAQQGVRILATTPPSDAVQNQWVTSLHFDPAQSFVDYWPQFVAGETGSRILVPLALAHVNPDQLSPGRQRFVEVMLADVNAGLVLMQSVTPQP